ncbi:SMP-30/gluconolactonase/LRE family protein [Chloroflexota bacterium]
MDINIEEYDKKIRLIVTEGATLERIATGFGFTEGPIWCGDYLLFSDIPKNRIVKLTMRSYGPEVTTFRTPSGNSNGLTLDRSGRLIACEHSTRRVTRTETDGTIRAVAEYYQGKRLNSPNDVVVRSDGSVYFTDPSFGLRNTPDSQALPFNGVYRITPDGELVLLVDDFELPNGLAFSPDEAVLYVNDTARENIRAFDVSPDGSISNGRVFTEMKASGEGRPDGMKVDQQGNVYCTGPGGLWIMEPGGKSLGRILMPEQPANFNWGDSDWKTLYITARPSIYRLRLEVPGIPVIRTGM